VGIVIGVAPTLEFAVRNMAVHGPEGEWVWAQTWHAAAKKQTYRVENCSFMSRVAPFAAEIRLGLVMRGISLSIVRATN
jgi:hypothetical protein